MAPDSIPFDRSLDAKSDTPIQVSPLVRRLIANNGGPFTFTGTCTYVVGSADVTIIDPGPDDSFHRHALLEMLGSVAVKAILVTHTHKDHAPGALALKVATGATILGPPLPSAMRVLDPTAALALDADHDRRYAPDRILAEGEAIDGPDYHLTVIATPGHTSNHLAFALAEENALFSGDHVMAWSTTVVAPPDGSMRAYMASLAKLQGRSDSIYWPGHGGPVNQPQRFVRSLAQHRRQREQAILARVAAGDRSPEAIVKILYEGLAPALRGAAGQSVLAHLESLVDQGLVNLDQGQGAAKTFTLAGAGVTGQP